jgi:hypothetical protein
LQQKQQQQQYSQTKLDTSRSQYSGLISYKRPRNPRDDLVKDDSEKRLREGDETHSSKNASSESGFSSSSTSASYSGGTAATSMVVNSALVHKVADTTTHQLLQAATSKSAAEKLASDKASVLSKSELVAGGVPHLYTSQYSFAPKSSTNLYEGMGDADSVPAVKLSPESYQSVDDMMKNPFARKVLQVAALSVAEYPDIHSRSPNNMLPNLYKLKTLPDLRLILGESGNEK